MTGRAVILSGAGRYADAWHDFAATSAEVARVLTGMGLQVAVRPLTPAGVAELCDGDLLVVNAGGKGDVLDDEPEEGWAEAFARLAAFRARGGALLGLHASTMTLRDWPEWTGWLGGLWVEGRSMHPPIGEAQVLVSDHAHPITEGLADFSVFDERYSLLDRFPAVRVLLHHEHEGSREPLVWVLDDAAGRRVYDALGHDARSFASPARVELLEREVRWLLDGGQQAS